MLCLKVSGPFRKGAASCVRYACDGRYFSNKGSVRVDYGDSNLLEVTGSDWRDFTIVRRGFRASEYVATFKFKWNNSTSPGWLVRWLDPGNFLAVVILQTDSKARLYQCEGDGGLSTLATSGTALNLTTDNWYEGKVVIDTDAGSQRLRFWVDTDRRRRRLQRRDHAAECQRSVKTVLPRFW